MAVKTALEGARSVTAITDDDTVQSFLQPDFDPVDYLNNSLPALATAARPPRHGIDNRIATLPELSSQLQSMLAQLNAQTIRLSTTLTQLTDEIVRSGGRLAYEVEVLRGDTLTLTDTLSSGLKHEMQLFLSQPETTGQPQTATVASVQDGSGPLQDESTPTTRYPNHPEYLERLQQLTEVRSKLDAVVKVFGEAMAWPVAPSEMASSLISISAPAADAESQTRERKAKEYVEQLHSEIADLLGTGSNPAGVEAAAERIESLKSLATVWKGTAEEKARAKVIETLQKPVEERLRVLSRSAPDAKPSAPVDYRYGDFNPTRTATEGGYGFLQNLRNLKNDVYLD